MEHLVVFIIGVIFGAAIVLIINWLRRREAQAIAQELISQVESQKIQDVEILINRIKESFGSLSLVALSKNSEEFLKLAGETLSKQMQIGEKELEGKKKLIDQTLEAMKVDLQKVQDLVTQFEKDRERKFGELANQLKLTAEQTGKLQETANKLYTALASTRVRGQWGERMAEDILRLSGLKEGINYLKQKAIQSGSTRPDYTFLLPNQLKVNMDVKFPYDNYMNYQNATSDSDKEIYKQNFLRDVRSRIKEVTTRDYINPAENTVDYVLVFIPNEHMYAFIMENDPAIIDEALKQRVILCSPITLYAILAIIRQAVDNFSLEQRASQIIELMGVFYKQWNEFLKSLENMGKKIDDAKKEFEKLTTTRKNQLEKPLKKIEELREAAGIKLDVDNNKLISNGNDHKSLSSDLDDE